MSDELGLIFRALAFAARKHRDQRRKDANATPYINHPIELAELLTNDAQITDVRVIAAAILHDTVEDTDATFTELESEFGQEIASIVAEVSDDKNLPSPQRKQLQIERAAGSSDQAKLVKLVDKICNLRDMTRNAPVDWGLQRKREYFDWANSVVEQIRGTNIKLEDIFDQQYRKRP